MALINRTRLLLLVRTATALKALAVVLFFQHPRTWEDAIMAANLIQTGELYLTHLGNAYHSGQFPVYPLAVSAMYAVFGLYTLPVVLLNLLLNALNAWVFVVLCEAFLDRMDTAGAFQAARKPIVWACALAFLAHPLINQYVMNNVHPFALDMLAFYAPVILVLRYFDRGARPVDLVLIGIATGFVLLTRTVLIVNLLPFVVLSLRESDWGSILKRAAVVLTIGLLVGVPWLVRNYQQDAVLGYTSTTGEILWKGALPGSEGSNFLSDGRSVRGVLSAAEDQHLQTMSVAEQNRFFTGKYLGMVQREPGRVAGMVLFKLRNFFWFRPLIGNDYGPEMRRFIPAYRVGYGTLLVLALASLPLFGMRTILVWSLLLGLGLFQSLFYVETRYRVVIEPLLIFLAATSVASLAQRFRRTTKSALQN